METYLNNPSVCSKNLIFYVLKWKGTEKIGTNYTLIFFLISCFLCDEVDMDIQRVGQCQFLRFFFFSFWGKLKYMTYKFYSEVILWGEMRWQSLWGIKGIEENWHVPGQAWEPFWLFHHFVNNYYRRMDFQIKIHLRQSGRTLPYQWNDPAKAERKSDINDVIGCEHRPHSRMVVLW